MWVQPSVQQILPFGLKIFDQANQVTAQAQHTLNVEQGSIRPVIIIPGFLGSYIKNGQWVLDPFEGVYTGLIENLYRLGYEDNRSLFNFPYQWYGKIRDTSQPNDIAYLAGKLRDQINTWSTQTVPEYVNKPSLI